MEVPKDAPNSTKLSFPRNEFNTGIPTGAKNNLLVVDIDVKDDGLAEFKKYITEHGDPNTLTVETRLVATTTILDTRTLTPTTRG